MRSGLTGTTDMCVLSKNLKSVESGCTVHKQQIVRNMSTLNKFYFYNNAIIALDRMLYVAR